MPDHSAAQIVSWFFTGKTSFLLFVKQFNVDKSAVTVSIPDMNNIIRL